MPEPQITIHELLKDPVYRRWLCKAPSLDRPGLVWRVWYKRADLPGSPGSVDKRWRQRDFPTYAKAFKFLRRRLRLLEDAAINCPGHEFKPPVVRTGWRQVDVAKIDPKTGRKSVERQRVPVRRLWTTLPDKLPPGHAWCGYCRRPTVFGWFNKHHALPRYCVNYERRCRICGVRLNFLGKWSRG